MPDPSDKRRGRQRLFASVAAIAIVPLAATMLPLPNSTALHVPIEACEGPDCAEGFGLLGDAPSRMALEAEADLGYSEYPEEPEEPEEPEYEYPSYSEPTEGEAPISTAQTDVLVNAFESANEECSYYELKWRIDCLAMRFQVMTQAVPSEAAYEPIRAELARTAAELRAIASANADPATPPARLAATVNGRTRTSARPLRAIAPARAAAATAAAEAALDGLSTRLLRSASTAASERIHFERAAEAVNSSKVLLRSA